MTEAERPPETDPSPRPHAEDGAGEHGWLRLPKRLRAPVRFVLSVCAAMALSAAVEAGSEWVSKDAEGSRAVLVGIEAEAAHQIAILKPDDLFNLYLVALSPSPEDEARMANAAAQSAHQRILRFNPRADPPPVLQAGGFVSDTERTLSVRVGHLSSSELHSPFAPLAAFVSVLWSLFSQGHLVAKIVLVMQLLVGAGLTAVLLNATAGWWTGIPYAPVLAFPVGAIVLASGTAFIAAFILSQTNRLMGGFGGLSAYLAIAGNCCAPFIQKAVELGAHKRVEGVIEKV